MTYFVRSRCNVVFLWFIMQPQRLWIHPRALEAGDAFIDAPWPTFVCFENECILSDHHIVTLQQYLYSLLFPLPLSPHRQMHALPGVPRSFYIDSFSPFFPVPYSLVPLIPIPLFQPHSPLFQSPCSLHHTVISIRYFCDCDLALFVIWLLCPWFLYIMFVI